MSEPTAAVLRRHPPWLKVRAPGGPGFTETKTTVKALGLHTVCEEARCPNSAGCWGQRPASFMLLGDPCPGNCAFCAVSHGRPLAVDGGEPRRVAEAVARLGRRPGGGAAGNRRDFSRGR